jgi:hypothetical protein
MEKVNDETAKAKRELAQWQRNLTQVRNEFAQVEQACKESCQELEMLDAEIARKA